MLETLASEGSLASQREGLLWALSRGPPAASLGRSQAETHLALQLGLLGGPRGSQAADHVLQLLIALDQQADLVAHIQTAGWAGGLRVDLAGHQGVGGLVRSYAQGQQRGGGAQHALNDGPELVQLDARQT